MCTISPNGVAPEWSENTIRYEKIFLQGTRGLKKIITFGVKWFSLFFSKILLHCMWNILITLYTIKLIQTKWGQLWWHILRSSKLLKSIFYRNLERFYRYHERVWWQSPQMFSFSTFTKCLFHLVNVINKHVHYFSLETGNKI